MISLCQEWVQYDNVYRAKFSALTAPELVQVSQCDWTDRPSLITIQFSRRVTVEYVSKANREGFKNSSSID